MEAKHAVLFDAFDPASIEIGNDSVLEPMAITDERIERHWRRELFPGTGPEIFEFEAADGIRYITGVPCRAEQHPLGHLLLPELHRLAEDHGFDASPPQMSRRCKPIGSCTNDRDLSSGRSHNFALNLFNVSNHSYSQYSNFVRKIMAPSRTQVAVIGAGPYGLAA